VCIYAIAIASELLYQEESVFVLPGRCFNIENFVRVVICPPPDVLKQAADRIRAFCARHAK
jgi:tyrosine aminotransferase